MGEPLHGPAFVSLGLRLLEVERRISDDAHFIHELAAILPSSPKKAVTSIGYERHPCTRRQGMSCRDPMYEQVVYRADAFSLYKQRPPELQTTVVYLFDRKGRRTQSVQGQEMPKSFVEQLR